MLRRRDELILTRDSNLYHGSDFRNLRDALGLPSPVRVPAGPVGEDVAPEDPEPVGEDVAPEDVGQGVAPEDDPDYGKNYLSDSPEDNADYEEEVADWKNERHFHGVKFDWSNTGVLSKVVYKQGIDGLCTYFSGKFYVESLHRIQNPRPYLRLSIQEVIDGTFEIYREPDHPSNPLQRLDNGVFLCRPIWFLQFCKEQGIRRVEDYPHTRVPHPWAPQPWRPKRMGDQFLQVGDRIFYSAEGDDPYVVELLRRQVLYASVPATAELDDWPNWKTTKVYRASREQAVAHAVVLVGHGSIRRKGGRVVNFFVAWNSWGVDWGYKGTFRVDRRSVYDVFAAEFVHSRTVGQ